MPSKLITRRQLIPVYVKWLLSQPRAKVPALKN